MRDILEYKLIEGNSSEDLNKSVNEALLDRWTLWNGPSVAITQFGASFIQAVTRISQVPHK